MIAKFATPLLFVALVLVPAGLHAQGRMDVRVADDVGRSIGTHPQLSIFDDVQARVLEGTVTLTGKVTAEYKRDNVARVIRRLEGVRDVRNEIAVLPASSFDDDLRYRISRAIYSNPTFWSYASMPRPPIHVIVERGRVTLTGVVGTEAERALARSLATGLGEHSVVNDLRTESASR